MDCWRIRSDHPLSCHICNSVLPLTPLCQVEVQQLTLPPSSLYCPWQMWKMLLRTRCPFGYSPPWALSLLRHFSGLKRGAEWSIFCQTWLFSRGTFCLQVSKMHPLKRLKVLRAPTWEALRTHVESFHILCHIRGEDTLGTPVHSNVWPTAYSLHRETCHYMVLFGSTPSEDVWEVAGWTSPSAFPRCIYDLLTYWFIDIFIHPMCVCLT